MDFQLPEIGEGVYEAELVSWFVQPGDEVKPGQNLMQVMTDKATMELPSPFRGKIRSLAVEPGDRLEVGDVVLTYEASAATAETEPGVPRPPASLAREVNGPHRQQVSRAGGPDGPRSPASAALTVKAAPSVRYLARKLGIDLTAVPGSGPGGRVLIEDLSTHVRPGAGTGVNGPVSRPRPDFGQPGTRLKMQGLRRLIAEHMVRAKTTIPHYSYVEECEVTELVKLRNSLRPAYTRVGIKLTYLAFFVKAAVTALKEVPLVNASLDEESEEIVLHDRYHLGIAVSTSGGLIVPVVHDADQKDLGTIAREIERLSKETRAGKARREDLSGGTFTVTSVGNIGGLFSTPVINHPEVAILGLGRIVRRPVFDEHGQVRPADLIYLSLSFDHRVVDGAVGAAFTNALVQQLTNPARLLLPPDML
jgi:2-oxoisovalerate dehydrogenase E2 component (dihydrolipoyl transacylase)